MRLIGGFEVEVDGRSVAPPSSRHARGLLAWLALHPGPEPRTRVAATFWPDVLDSSARGSLRTAIWALRQTLGADANVLLVTRDHLGLDPSLPVEVDVAEFDRAVAAGRLEEAADLVSGELLPGFEDEWVLQARDEVSAKVGATLERLARQADQRGDVQAALAWTRRQVKLDPLAEEPHRRLMQRLAAGGDRAAAVVVYTRLHDRLRRELQIEPSVETRRLVDELNGAAPSPPPVNRPVRALPLVGRDRELRTLAEAWRAARAGAGSVATVCGDPGIGKTRLVTELVDRVRAGGGRAATCAALDLGARTPLALWAELIGDLTADIKAPGADVVWPAALTPLVPDLTHRFGNRPGAWVPASPDLERARLYEATVSLLEWVGRRPLLLVLEDIHAADAASLELIGYVGRRLARLPILVVMTRRPRPRRAEVDALEHALRTRETLAHELTVAPLPTVHAARLISFVGQVTEADVDHIIAAADGNPLVVVELARALARGDREPPAGVRGAVRAALAPLTPDASRLADLAAVAGRSLSLAELELLAVPDPSDAAAAVLDCGLFESRDGGIGFRHAVLGEAAYHDLPEPRRRAVHARLADVLAGESADGSSRDAAEAARHYRLAGQVEAAVHQLIRAAAYARSVAAPAEAVRCLEEATELAPGRFDLLLGLAEAMAWLGLDDESEAAFVQAIEALGPQPPPVEQARALAHRANWSRGALCLPRRVRESGQKAIELIESAATPAADVELEALTAWAWAEAVAGDVEVADTLLDRARALAPAAVDDLVTYWTADAAAFSLLRRGRLDESCQRHCAAGEAAERAGRPDLAYSCWCNAACAAACAGHFDQALAFVDRGLISVRGAGLATLEVQLLAARAHILMRLGRSNEAEAASQEECRLADRLGVPAMVAMSEHDAGMVALGLGRFARAAHHLAGALRGDAPISRPLTRLARAESLIGLGCYDEAETEVRAAVLEPVRPSDMPDTLVPRLSRVQGLIAAGRGDLALAGRRLDEAADGWRRLIGAVGDGDRYTTVLTDLGRPPMAGLVEPVRELARAQTERAALTTSTSAK